MSRKVVFEGVVVGFDDLGGNVGEAVYIQGTLDGRSTSFYILVDKSVLESLKKHGVGRMISGKGLAISEDPIIIRAEETTIV